MPHAVKWLFSRAAQCDQYTRVSGSHPCCKQPGWTFPEFRMSFRALPQQGMSDVLTHYTNCKSGHACTRGTAPRITIKFVAYISEFKTLFIWDSQRLQPYHKGKGYNADHLFRVSWPWPHLCSLPLLEEGFLVCLRRGGLQLLASVFREKKKGVF